jgi:hypothetical protein
MVSSDGEVVLVNVHLRAGLPEDGQPGFIEPELKVRLLIGCGELADDAKDRGRFSWFRMACAGAQALSLFRNLISLVHSCA